MKKKRLIRIVSLVAIALLALAFQPTLVMAQPPADEECGEAPDEDVVQSIVLLAYEPVLWLRTVPLFIKLGAIGSWIALFTCCLMGKLDAALAGVDLVTDVIVAIAADIVESLAFVTATVATLIGVIAFIAKWIHRIDFWIWPACRFDLIGGEIYHFIMIRIWRLIEFLSFGVAAIAFAVGVGALGVEWANTVGAAQAALDAVTDVFD